MPHHGVLGRKDRDANTSQLCSRSQDVDKSFSVSFGCSIRLRSH